MKMKSMIPTAVRIVVAAGLVASCLTGSTTSAQLSPAGRPAMPATKPASKLSKAEAAKLSADVLTAQGADAAALGDFKVARDCFLDATTLDRTNRRAYEGLGYSYVKLNDVKRASTAFEAAAAIGTAGPPGRSLSMNLAFTLLRVRNPMRAGKVLKDYMANNSVDVQKDEEVLEALGICLNQAGDEARLTRLWKELVAFYEQQTTKLEATRPGQRRWGNDWVSSAEYSRKESFNQQIQSELNTKNVEIRTAQAGFNRAEAQYNSARIRRVRGPVIDPTPFKAEMNRYSADLDRLNEEWKTINAKMERPKFPNLFEPVGLDDVPPPSTVIASAGSSGTGSPRDPLGTTRIGGTPTSPPVVSKPTVIDNPPATPPARPTVVDPPVATVRPPVERPVTNPPVARPPATTPPVTTPPVAVAPRPAVTSSGPRRVTAYGVGFAVAPDLLVTAAGVVGNAAKIEIQPAGMDDRYPAEIVKVDQESGLALIRVQNVRMGFLGIASAFAGGAVTCASFPSAGLFGATAEVIPGIAPAPKADWQVRLNKHPRLSGAPLIAGGNVVGVATGNRDDEPSAMPSVGLDKLRALVPQPAPQGVSDPTNAIAQIIVTREN